MHLIDVRDVYKIYNPGEKPNFLITEAMRGFGAILRLPSGEEFMEILNKK